MIAAGVDGLQERKFGDLMAGRSGRVTRLHLAQAARLELGWRRLRRDQDSAEHETRHESEVALKNASALPGHLESPGVPSTVGMGGC